MKTKKIAKVTLAFLMVLLTALSVAFISMNSVGAAETENEELLSTSMDKTNVTTSIRGNGIRIMWNRVSGAESYTVEYFEGDFPCRANQTWEIAESGITNSQYDKEEKRVYCAFLKAQYGKVYHFRVRTNLREHGWSISDTSNECPVFYTQKTKLSFANASNGIGIKVKWGSVTNAKNYRLFYRETTSNNWKYKDTTNNEYILSGSVNLGRTYAFQILPISSVVKADGDYSKVQCYLYTSQPSVSTSNKSNGIRVEWNKVAGAQKYEVYYRNKNTSNWSKTVTTNTFYPFLSAQSGETYVFQVRPVGSSEICGTYSGTKKWLYLSSPKNVSTSNRPNGIRVMWNKVAGAKKYRVYYRNSNTSTWNWTETTDTCYPFIDAQAGKAYAFQIRPIGPAGEGGVFSSVIVGTFFPTGPNAKPVVKLTNVMDGLRIEWEKTYYASAYDIYFRICDGNEKKEWTACKKNYTTCRGTRYEFKVFRDGPPNWKVTLGGTYEVQVIPVYEGINNTNYVNHSAVARIVYNPKRPTITVSNKPNGVRIEWNSVPDTKYYKVYCRPSSSSAWSILDVTTNNYHPYKTANAGIEYAFQVIAFYDSSEKYYAASDVDYITYFPVFDGTKFMNTLKDSEDNFGIIYQKYSDVTDDTDWCTLYLRYMLETKLDKRMSKAVGYNSFTDNWIDEAKNIVKTNGYTPKVGDIVFLYRGATAGHVGIVTAVRGSNITYISGNTGSANPAMSRVGLATTDWHYRSPYDADYKDPVAGYIPLSRYMTTPQ